MYTFMNTYNHKYRHTHTHNVQVVKLGKIQWLSVFIPLVTAELKVKYLSLFPDNVRSTFDPALWYGIHFFNFSMFNISYLPWYVSSMKLLFQSHVAIGNKAGNTLEYFLWSDMNIYPNFSQARWTQTVNGTFSEKTLGLNMMSLYFCGEICYSFAMQV